MTSQAQPLAVGVPLYPFSNGSLFDPNYQSSSELDGSASILTNPLPHPTQYNGDEDDVPAIVELNNGSGNGNRGMSTHGLSGLAALAGGNVWPSTQGARLEMAPDEVVQFNF